MTKFKVGDIVVVRPLAQIRAWEKEHGIRVPWVFATDMGVYCGQTFTIRKVEQAMWDGMTGPQARYILKDTPYVWSDPMLDYADDNL